MSKIGIDHELALAAAEHSRATAREEKLKSTADDWTLPAETRLAAQMTLDTIAWKRHSRVQDQTDDVPDRITIAKKRAERQRLARVRVQRLAAGLPTRPRKGRPTGIWASGEQADSFLAADGRCVVCGRGHERLRSKTCSPECGRAARAAKKAQKAIVNHSGEAAGAF